MFAKSKALWFVPLPALMLALLVLATDPGQAVPKTKTVSQCETDNIHCLDKCGDKHQNCLKQGWDGCEVGRIVCKDNCNTIEKDCIKDAGKSAPVPFKPKVQPKAQPGGAEQPGTGSPSVRPEGGVQRY